MADHYFTDIPRPSAGVRGRLRRSAASARSAALALAGVILLTLSVAAHDFWIEPSSFRPPVNSVVNVHLRVGDHFEGEVVGRNSSTIESFTLTTSEGQQRVVGREGGDPAGMFRVTAPGTMLLAYRSRPTMVELTGPEFEQYLREEGLRHVIEARARDGRSEAPGRERFSRSVKALLHAGGLASGGHDRVLGLTLELIPEQDPSTLAAGARLTVRLLYEGRPLAGTLVMGFSRTEAPMTVEAGRHPEPAFKARSDKDGRVRVPMVPGVWLIKAVHMVPAPEGSGVEWESIWASLTFSVPTPPAGRVAAGPARIAPFASDR